MTRLFVFGLGYSARAVVTRMHAKLDAVVGTTRHPNKLGEIANLGVAPILFDASESDATARAKPPDPPIPKLGGAPMVRHALSKADLVLVSIAPDASGDPVLRHFRDELAGARPRSLVYLSTVGVYGDYGGAWVDETSECRPVSARSKERLVAEREWRTFAAETGVPVAIVRLAGIYGPGRGPFEKIRRGTARRIVKPGQIFNRIHVDDIAAIVQAALENGANGIFNGSDDEPAPPQDVIAFAAGMLGMPPPPEVPFADAELSEMARSFYGESKRVRNDKIKAELGVRLTYPTYREGLAALHRPELPARPIP